MTDDIVTRLRGSWDCSCLYIKEHGLDRKCLHCEASDEIERLRAIIQDISDAVTDEGKKPGYHRQQLNYVRTMWNPLWEAISKAVKETTNE